MIPNHIKIGREKYSQADQMINWCTDIIGHGKPYYFGHRDAWDLPDGVMWSMESMFGYSTFYFRRDEDLSLFVLRWL